MNQNFQDECFEVPDERDLDLPTDRKEVTSPSPKSSKLCVDKGFVKVEDLESFCNTSKYKSSQNVLSPLAKNHASNFGDAVMKSNPKRMDARRVRVNSVSNEFKLVPLLRKVSCTPDETDDNRDSKLGCGERPTYFEKKYLANIEASENSISEESEDVVITVGDVLPANANVSK